MEDFQKFAFNKIFENYENPRNNIKQNLRNCFVFVLQCIQRENVHN